MSNPSNVQRVMTFFADDQLSVGWTETLYLFNTSIQAAFTEAGILAGLRANWLSDKFRIQWIRIETAFNAKQFYAGPPNLGSVIPGNYSTGDAVYPTTRLLVELRGQNGGQVNRIFAGGLTSAEFTNQAFAPTPDFLDRFNPWAARLKSGVGIWSLLNRTNGGVGAARPISSFIPTPPRGNSIVTDDNSTLFPGAVIRINAPATSVQGLQGYKVVLSKTGTTLFTIGGGVGVGILPAPSRTTWQLTNFAVANVYSVFAERVTERRVGRPFGQPVGRRPNRIPLR